MSGPWKRRTKPKDTTAKSAWGNYVHKVNKNRYDEKANSMRKNHVSETDLSPGGQPFHFAGPKKST